MMYFVILMVWFLLLLLLFVRFFVQSTKYAKYRQRYIRSSTNGKMDFLLDYLLAEVIYLCFAHSQHIIHSSYFYPIPEISLTDFQNVMFVSHNCNNKTLKSNKYKFIHIRFCSGNGIFWLHWEVGRFCVLNTYFMLRVASLIKFKVRTLSTLSSRSLLGFVYFKTERFHFDYFILSFFFPFFFWELYTRILWYVYFTWWSP